MLPPAAGWFRSPVGSIPAPEAIAEPLPPNAVYIGEGTEAKGVIATTGIGALGMDWTIPGWLKLAAVAGIAFWIGKKL